MANENLKPISARLNPETINAIDQFVQRHRYWKRNAIINQILTTVFSDFSESDIYDMCRRSGFRNQEIEAHYKMIRA